MDILTPKQTRDIMPSYKNIFEDTAFYDALLKTDVGGSVVISYREWPLKEYPNSTKINNMMRKMGHTLSFRIRSVQRGKQFAFIRLT